MIQNVCDVIVAASACLGLFTFIARTVITIRRERAKAKFQEQAGLVAASIIGSMIAPGVLAGIAERLEAVKGALPPMLAAIVGALPAGPAKSADTPGAPPPEDA